MPVTSPASVPHSIAYLSSAALFAFSVLAEPPLVYWMWAAALAVGLTGWGAKTSLIAMVALLLGTAYTGLRVWARMALAEHEWQQERTHTHPDT